ncbi:hypothetical protein ACTQ45_08610 [Fundicoccus sp. Sow4_D5]|uniref:hypothetical protein n=1 Tax=unclassified Fundicoccus TaxID=2761543 RepID=UPI003F904A0D
MSKRAFIVRNLSSLFPNQKGIVLPVVMVFMVLSQTVYWGVLHLNQINSQQYKQFQAYYQAEIQNSMVDHLLIDDDSVFALTLENQLFDHLLKQHDLMVKNLAIESWLLEKPQVGLARLSSAVDRERLFLYRQLVYLDQEQLDYCLLFQDIECFGQLNSNGTYDPKSFNLAFVNTDTFDSLQAQLVDDGFVLNHTLKRNFLDALANSDFSEINFKFNLGYVSIFQLSDLTYQYTTQLKHIDYSVTKRKPIRTTQYLLIWQGYIYERASPVNK